MRAGYDQETNTFHFRSGKSVRVRPISHYLVSELRKQTPPPAPPKQIVELVGGITEEVENTAHPDYIQQMADYNALIAEKWRNLVLLRGVDMDIDHDAVKILRRDTKRLGLSLPDDDGYVYLFYICIGSYEEEQNLLNVIHGYSAPTEESIAQAVSTF